MNRCLVALGAIAVFATIAGPLAAVNPKFPHGDARRSMGNLRHGSGHAAGGLPHAATHHRPHAVPYHREYVCYRPYYGRAYRHPYPYEPYAYDAGYPGYGYPYPYPYYPPYYYHPPPLFIPAETLYGPQAVRRFFGFDRWDLPAPQVNVIVPEGNDARRAEADEKRAEKEAAKEARRRAAGRKAEDLAWKFIGFGDAHFRDQRYPDANVRYRKAIRARPQLAAGWFRQAYALAAQGRYDLAVRNIKRGLELDPAWPRSDFRNEELYGANQMAKKAHLDALAKAAEEDPDNADLLFLVGVQLHFDGQPQRAVPFFQRALQLAGRDNGHVKAFTDN